MEGRLGAKLSGQLLEGGKCLLTARTNDKTEYLSIIGPNVKATLERKNNARPVVIINFDSGL